MLNVASGNYGSYVGFLNVTFNSQGQIVAYNGDTILLTSQFPNDPVIDAEINATYPEVVAATANVVGYSECA